MFYTIKLTPNHRELTPTLIGITENPEAFITKWLKDRSQFSGELTKREDGTIRHWRGINSYNKGWATLPPEYRTHIQYKDGEPLKDAEGKFVPDESFEYQITTKSIDNEIWLNLTLEGDARYCL